jgi:hypothetical protein
LKQTLNGTARESKRGDFMTEGKLFGVVVRAFGLWSILLCFSAVNGIAQLYGVRNMSVYDWQPAGAFAAFYLVAGIFLLRKSESVVEFAYTERTPKPSDDSE